MEHHSHIPPDQSASPGSSESTGRARFRVIRPQCPDAETERERSNAFVKQVGARVRAEVRARAVVRVKAALRKLLGLALVLAGAYVAVAAAVCVLLSEKVAEAGRRLPGIRVAISQALADQSVMSMRPQAIVGALPLPKPNKADEVAAVLGDETLNLMARVYCGADWSARREELSLCVAQTRKLVDGKRRKLESDVQKVRQLERCKRTRLMRLNVPGERLRVKNEIGDLDLQMAKITETEDYRTFVKKDEVNVRRLEAESDAAVKLVSFASECQADALGELTRAVAEKLDRLLAEERAAVRLRTWMSYFSVWPVSLFVRMPVER